MLIRSKNKMHIVNIENGVVSAEGDGTVTFRAGKIRVTFLVACIVAIWIICNEIISILENIKDMGVIIPAFLIPLVTHVKSQVEDKVNIDTEKEDSEGE